MIGEMMDKKDRLFLAKLGVYTCNIIIHFLGDGMQVQRWRDNEKRIRSEFEKIAEEE